MSSGTKKEVVEGELLQEEDLDSNKSTSSESAEKQEAKQEDGRSSNGIRHQKSGEEPKEKRAPLKRDFTQTSVSSSSKDGGAEPTDNSDWAKRNQGNKKVLDLVAKFSEKGTEKSEVKSGAVYKNDYGVGKKIGQIQQDKFH